MANVYEKIAELEIQLEIATEVTKMWSEMVPELYECYLKVANDNSTTIDDVVYTIAAGRVCDRINSEGA